LEKLGVPLDADYYLCGPAPFLREFKTNLKTGRFHAEIFGPDESTTPGIASVQRTPHPPPGVPGSGPQVSFTRSGLSVRWDARYQSLLELAEACDISVRWSCRTGVCHTCESALIGGAVQYTPDPLEPPADGNVLICCSRPQVDIELDL
jgi:ferredoxin